MLPCSRGLISERNAAVFRHAAALESRPYDRSYARVANAASPILRGVVEALIEYVKTSYPGEVEVVPREGNSVALVRRISPQSLWIKAERLTVIVSERRGIWYLTLEPFPPHNRRIDRSERTLESAKFSAVLLLAAVTGQGVA